MTFETNIGSANLRSEVSLYWNIGKQSNSKQCNKESHIMILGVTFPKNSFRVPSEDALAPLGAHKGSQIEFWE